MEKYVVIMNYMEGESNNLIVGYFMKFEINPRLGEDAVFSSLREESTEFYSKARAYQIKDKCKQINLKAVRCGQGGEASFEVKRV